MLTGIVIGAVIVGIMWFLFTEKSISYEECNTGIIYKYYGLGHTETEFQYYILQSSETGAYVLVPKSRFKDLFKEV